ncbi:hypothetical protein CHLRE_09g414100v5 [Chlamydomonas reinhardtii]|uniref:Uncharacterized protein n=1 Tax=Chlamydomonas reinhardtii TaxID=3055 RepID=A0A2K3DFU9_CHLRE|nr:uncharacterized protein CHLRE_09g414100v5 [Chlamydomonas reinhardtii]PNW79414.1 hypothetical protein CHLRE_09g414100v5 [Chlamydomonas reinhardtii]
MMEPVARKLKNDQCITALVFGNSVSCGATVGRDQAWPHRLFEALNRVFPCRLNQTHRGYHNLTVYCEGGRTSAFFKEWLPAELWAFNQTDLFFVDTDVTDGALTLSQQRDGYHGSIQDQIQSAADTLSALLLTKRPYDARQWNGKALIWLASSSMGLVGYDSIINPWDGNITQDRWMDCVPWYQPIMQHHGVPLLSTIDALGPFRSNASKAWFHWNFLRDHWDHPDVPGHEFMTELIMHYIKTVVASVDMLLPWETVREPYEVRSPIKAEYSNVRMFVDANPFFILLHRLGGQYDNPGFFEHMLGGKKCDDWAIGEAKPGFISTKINATCGWVVNATEVQEHVKYGRLHIMVMKSYEHMGVMGVEVRAVGQPTCTSATLPMEPRLLNSTSVDLLWTSHSSMGRTHHLNIGTAFPQGACLLINVTVMPTSRAENKVKLLGFTVF